MTNLKNANKSRNLGKQVWTSGGPLSEDRLASEIGIFFLAGFETTGHSGAWLLYLLSQHPEVEAKICQELDQHGLLRTAGRPNPRKVTYEDLSKLSYLDMAIKVGCDGDSVLVQSVAEICLEASVWVLVCP